MIEIESKTRRQDEGIEKWRLNKGIGTLNYVPRFGKTKVATKISSKLIDKSIELLENRLEEGDYQYDPKTGKMIRVPLKARDANRILNDAQQAVLNIDKESRKVEQQKKVEDIADRLTKIAQAFSNVRPKEVKGEVLDGYVTEKEQ